MAKDVRADIETMRAADTDRQKVADQLKTALDEGRLTLHEYDERVGLAYGAKTYQELLMLLTDLPRPGVSASEVQAEQRRKARRLPTAMLVLWTIWAALTLINLVVYALVAMSTDADIYPWPVWMLVPGTALAAVSVGVQVIRHQQRR
ncbi:DUF1707 SHOCT-like domain-containing protein [Actinoplanes solisilvae]|uniref:DUF1707 SHOCT-like domain-containing protein n=1 Tax=Actinoplanes solisilvae TaxID=2486853 RepID=UPI001F0BA0D3|nr:DUF1707 domain-containing protein [Actinoplanes solisilvae]